MLKTLGYQHAFLEKATTYQRFRRMRNLKHPSNSWFEAAPPLPKRVSADFTDNEVIVTVRTYKPLKASVRSMAASTTNPSRYIQEVWLLGSNLLSELRDKIKCPADFAIPGEMSDSPPWKKAKTDPKVTSAAGSKHYKSSSKEAPKMARELYPSGFFFIEGCFYRDLRQENCFDTSEVIRKWAKDPKRQIGPFTTGVMESAKIGDLTIRLGYPYVYVHQGDHEHLISFVDVRLASVDDVQWPSSYPMERAISVTHSKMCMVCNIYVAKWVTKNNQRVSYCKQQCHNEPILF